MRKKLWFGKMPPWCSSVFNALLLQGSSILLILFLLSYYFSMFIFNSAYKKLEGELEQERREKEKLEKEVKQREEDFKQLEKVRTT